MGMKHPFWKSPKAEQADAAQAERDAFVDAVFAQIAAQRHGRVLRDVRQSVKE